LSHGSVDIRDGLSQAKGRNRLNRRSRRAKPKVETVGRVKGRDRLVGAKGGDRLARAKDRDRPRNESIWLSQI